MFGIRCLTPFSSTTGKTGTVYIFPPDRRPRWAGSLQKNVYCPHFPCQKMYTVPIFPKRKGRGERLGLLLRHRRQNLLTLMPRHQEREHQHARELCRLEESVDDLEIGRVRPLRIVPADLEIGHPRLVIGPGDRNFEMTPRKVDEV